MANPVDPERVVAALHVLGWPDDRSQPYGLDALPPAELYYRHAEDAIRAADDARPKPASSSLRDQITEPAVVDRAVECDIEWTDLRSSRPGAQVTLTALRRSEEEFDAALAHEIAGAEKFHKVPVRVRRRDVTTYADKSVRTYPWVEVRV